MEIDEAAEAAWYAEIMRAGLPTEEDGATIAGAQDLPLAWIEKVLVQRIERSAAKLTALIRL